VADYANADATFSGSCEPSKVMNGMLVWEPPSSHVPQEATFANDEQVNQIAVYCPDIPYNPLYLPICLNHSSHYWSLLQRMQKLNAAPHVATSNCPIFATGTADQNRKDEKFACKLLSSAGVNFTGRNPLLATGVLFVVGDMHWRAVLFDTRAKTLYLFDPMGRNGWENGDAGSVKQLLLQVGTRYGFKVMVMDMKVQYDAFQCGPWSLCISRVFGTFLVAATPGDWPSFCLRWLADAGVPAGVPAHRNRRDFIAAQRREFMSHYCDNPRSRAQPAPGRYFPEVERVMYRAHFSLDHSSYEFKLVAAQMGMGHPRGHLEPEVTLEHVLLTDSRQFQYHVRTRNGEAVPCKRDGCRQHLQGCCGLEQPPAETEAVFAQECKRLNILEAIILIQQAGALELRNGNDARIYHTVPYRAIRPEAAALINMYRAVRMLGG